MERDRVRAGAVQTLAAQLAAAEERHRTDVARLEAEAAENRNAVTRDAQVAAERDRVRAEVERTLASEITRLEAEAAESRADIARLKTEAGDTRPSLEQVHSDEEAVDASAVTDYYKLWRTRFAAADTQTVTAGAIRPPQVEARRRRWALSVAAALLILLTNNTESGSAPPLALATVDAADGTRTTGPVNALTWDATLRTPTTGDTEQHGPLERATGDAPEAGINRRASLSVLVLELMCVLVVMLLLRVSLFVGEGIVWHGLVVALGLTLVGFVVMRAPWGG